MNELERSFHGAPRVKHAVNQFKKRWALISSTSFDATQVLLSFEVPASETWYLIVWHSLEKARSNTEKCSCQKVRLSSFGVSLVKYSAGCCLFFDAATSQHSESSITSRKAFSPRCNSYLNGFLTLFVWILRTRRHPAFSGKKVIGSKVNTFNFEWCVKGVAASAPFCREQQYRRTEYLRETAWNARNSSPFVGQL